MGSELPALTRMLALGGVAGLLLGTLLAFLLEMADQSYRSPDDITRQLGVPVWAHSQHGDRPGAQAAGDDAVHPSLVTYHRPGSQMPKPIAPCGRRCWRARATNRTR